MFGESFSLEESPCLARLLEQDGLVDCGGPSVCDIAAGLLTSKLISISNVPAINDRS